MDERKHDYLKTLKQFMKFGAVGVSNTCISYFSYLFLVYCGLNYILANMIGFILSVLNAYHWNQKYVFGGGKPGTGEFGRMVLSYGFTGVLSTALLFVWVDILEISSVIAPILNLLITTPLNFLLNRNWAFHNKREI